MSIKGLEDFAAVPQYARDQQDLLPPASKPPVETFSTGMVRDVQDDKLRYELIPVESLKRLAAVYTKGAKKYAPNNWRKGAPLSRTLASLLRHVYAPLLGESVAGDDDFYQAVFNLFTLAEHIRMIEAGELPAELDDLGLTNKKG